MIGGIGGCSNNHSRNHSRALFPLPFIRSPLRSASTSNRVRDRYTRCYKKVVMINAIIMALNNLYISTSPPLVSLSASSRRSNYNNNFRSFSSSSSYLPRFVSLNRQLLLEPASSSLYFSQSQFRVLSFLSSSVSLFLHSNRGFRFHTCTSGVPYIKSNSLSFIYSFLFDMISHNHKIFATTECSRNVRHSTI